MESGVSTASSVESFIGALLCGREFARRHILARRRNGLEAIECSWRAVTGSEQDPGEANLG
jgi:hypothetical protein